MNVPDEVKVIIKTISGAEADTVLAQARGFRRLSQLVGLADSDPAAFVQEWKRINLEAVNEGA